LKDRPFTNFLEGVQGKPEKFACKIGAGIEVYCFVKKAPTAPKNPTCHVRVAEIALPLRRIHEP
jgi:hypothetical protein